ncbi:MAG: photosynthetic reaction center subunit H [Burkholderiales bacterium]|nr:photosynthetic reaction center subunit H [Burkholderiales bacterium]
MGTGAITQYIDVAQIALYAFWIFFAGLIYYLHQEDKREGYPLESDRSGGRVKVQGWPPIPKPKTYKLADGRIVMSPNFRTSNQPLGGSPASGHLGSPLEPKGDPMLAAVGPGSYADRADIADTTVDGGLRIVPLRAAHDFEVSSHDPDPRGLPVVGADGRIGGTVRDLWVDRAEVLFRYLEVEVQGGTRRVLLPINFSRIGDRQVQVRSILSTQFANVPVTRNPDAVTLLEEDKIMGYYGGGTLYATADRQEPLL